MSKNAKQGGISPHHVRLILNQVWRGHTTDVERVIKILQDANLVGSDDLPLSAAADQYARIPINEFDRAVVGMPIDRRIRAKLHAAAAGLIA